MIKLFQLGVSDIGWWSWIMVVLYFASVAVITSMTGIIVFRNIRFMNSISKKDKNGANFYEQNGLYFLISGIAVLVYFASALLAGREGVWVIRYIFSGSDLIIAISILACIAILLAFYFVRMFFHSKRSSHNRNVEKNANKKRDEFDKMFDKLREDVIAQSGSFVWNEVLLSTMRRFVIPVQDAKTFLRIKTLDQAIEMYPENLENAQSEDISVLFDIELNGSIDQKARTYTTNNTSEVSSKPVHNVLVSMGIRKIIYQYQSPRVGVQHGTTQVGNGKYTTTTNMWGEHKTKEGTKTVATTQQYTYYVTETQTYPVDGDVDLWHDATDHITKLIEGVKMGTPIKFDCSNLTNMQAFGLATNYESWESRTNEIKDADNEVVNTMQMKI